MRIQYLKTLLDGNVTTRKGAIVETDDWKARELIALGYAVHIPEVEKSMAAPLVAAKAAADGEATDPFAERRATGRDGSAKPASSSQEAPARPKRTYKKRAAAAK